MAVTPEGFKEFVAEVIEVKGECGADHEKGQVFTVSCWDTGGLCGYFYHDIFPTLQTLQFGGVIPWAPEGEISLECPDRYNAVTVKIRAKG